MRMVRRRAAEPARRCDAALWLRHGVIALALLGAVAPVAAAEVLMVGPAQRFQRPSDAAAAARDGDTVRIDPGRYVDCAVWRAARIAIVAAGGGEVEITGPVCDGKALFVISGPGVVVEGITFRGAAAPDRNGAGIRAEGGDLTVRRSRFADNESGILSAAGLRQAQLVVEDSVFTGNGALRGRSCGGHALYANELALLAIRRSRFEATRACHHVKSRAARTEITDSVIADGPRGGASYLLDLPNGGDLMLERSLLAKGPLSGNPRVAVMVGAEGLRWPTRSLVLRGNRFENHMRRPTILLENRSATPALLEGNTLAGPVTPLSGPGAVR
jgi:hypothetical protein